MAQPSAVVRFLALVIGLAALATAGAAGADPVAKSVFGQAREPAGATPASHGGYARGCIAGAVALAETGPAWQAMRLSRNRNWGHPEAIAFIERLGRAAQGIGWPGLYVGDISQPRGGPMRSGHRSHQIGLDIDVWFREPSDRPLSRAERERIGSPSVVAGNGRGVNANWTPGHAAVLRAASRDTAVARIFVNAAIKAELCRSAPAGDRYWLRKVRPWWGHDSHFHVRLACPAGANGCESQPPVPAGDGCDDTLAWWFSDEARNPKPIPGRKPRGPLRLSDLPDACRRLAADLAR